MLGPTPSSTFRGTPTRAGLDYYGLPHLTTPEELAAWLQMPIGKVAWLTYRFCENRRPQSAKEAHYHFRWIRKRSGGHRLIEAPKKSLRTVQHRILRDILDRIPPHAQAHGFIHGRSILSNAQPHVGKRVIVKFDLDNFYAAVRQSRIVAIFRSLGFSREVALWLARLTTSAAPGSLKLPLGESASIWRYMPRHLPQGAPTSPALANLSAFGLDVRLSGLAKAWHVDYTRYADDLTFSGDPKFVAAVGDFIPLVQQVIRDEGFPVQACQGGASSRANQRQSVTGVVVNERINISRADYDRLKATLYNCVKHGPASQNTEDRPDFAAHLRGRIFVCDAAQSPPRGRNYWRSTSRSIGIADHAEGTAGGRSLSQFLGREFPHSRDVDAGAFGRKIERMQRPGLSERGRITGHDSLPRADRLEFHHRPVGGTRWRRSGRRPRYRPGRDRRETASPHNRSFGIA